MNLDLVHAQPVVAGKDSRPTTTMLSGLLDGGKAPRWYSCGRLTCMRLVRMWRCSMPKVQADCSETREGKTSMNSQRTGRRNCSKTQISRILASARKCVLNLNPFIQKGIRGLVSQ